MLVEATGLLGLILAFVLSLSPTPGSQQEQQGNETRTPRTDGSAQASPPAASVKKSRGPISDYVPCLFGGDEQFDMRAQVAPKQPPRPLDARAAQQLLDATRVALSPTLAQYRQQNSDFLKEFYRQFELFDFKSLIGMTPEQANAHIQGELVKAVENAAESQKGKGKYLESDAQSERTKVQAANGVAANVATAANEFLKTNKQVTDEKAKASLIEDTRNAILKPNFQNGLSITFLNSVHDAYQPDAAALSRLSSRQWPEYLAYIARETAMSATQDPLSQSAAVNVADAEEASLKAVLAASTNQVVAETEAKSAVQQFQPPDDVSCSMSVMSWKETSDIFGRRVANAYLAIQVTLRNLNSKNEFLVHDIQVAIDTGVSPSYFGRFQAGRDKLLVRAVAQRGQSEDRRNLVLNTLQTVGAIAAAGSIAIDSAPAKDAIAVFQSAFIPGFANIFPDHTVEQLNHINDLVFSASNTSKVLVPIQGSVPLVTFIPEKPIEQLPFAWCGHPPSGRIKSLLRANPEQNCEFNADRPNDVSNMNVPGVQNSGYVGPYRYNKWGQIDDGGNGSVDHGADSSDRPWADLRYKEWRGAALRMLQQHTFVVVGGVHIQEVVTQPKIANLDCQTLSGGQIDISQQKDGMVNCAVTGSGLGLVNEVSLEKGSVKIVGKIKAAGDGNSASLQFKPDEMCDADGVHSLFLTFKSNSTNEPSHVDSGESVSLVKQPSVGGAKLASGVLTVTGKCLDEVTDVSLAPVGTENAVKGADFTAKDRTQATATFTTLTDQAVYYLVYGLKAQQNKPIEARSVTVTFEESANDQSEKTTSTKKPAGAK